MWGNTMEVFHRPTIDSDAATSGGDNPSILLASDLCSSLSLSLLKATTIFPLFILFMVAGTVHLRSPYYLYIYMYTYIYTLIPTLSFPIETLSLLLSSWISSQILLFISACPTTITPI
jgi:hypothetical protein